MKCRLVGRSAEDISVRYETDQWIESQNLAIRVPASLIALKTFDLEPEREIVNTVVRSNSMSIVYRHRRVIFFGTFQPRSTFLHQFR